MPVLGRSTGGGHGNSLQYSCLESHMDRGAWRVTVHGVTKNRTWLRSKHTMQILKNWGNLYRRIDFKIKGMLQFSSVAQSCPTLCDPMNRSTPGLPVHHQLSEFTQTHIHRVGDAIQPSHPLSSPSPPASNPSQRQSLFQWVNSLHEVAKVLEFQL